MATNGGSLQCAGTNIGAHRHICAFFNGLDEEHRVLGSFYKDGFDRGEKITHIVAADTRDEYLQRLADAGTDIQRMTETGQLEVLRWSKMYALDHRFDQDSMLASVERIIQTDVSAGYARSKLVGHHLDWLFRDQSVVNNLVEYEARLNGVLSKYDVPVVCVYDYSKIGASVALDIMRTHPLVIIGGLLRQNPFFVPPEQFLEELRERRSSTTDN
jgi:hypothetical protein